MGFFFHSKYLWKGGQLAFYTMLNFALHISHKEDPQGSSQLKAKT